MNRSLNFYRNNLLISCFIQVLSDLIVDELNYTVLRDIYYNIKGPTAVRMSIRNKVLLCCKFIT